MVMLNSAPSALLAMVSSDVVWSAVQKRKTSPRYRRDESVSTTTLLKALRRGCFCARPSASCCVLAFAARSVTRFVTLLCARLPSPIVGCLPESRVSTAQG